MSRLASLSSRRIVLLSLVVAALLATFSALSPAPAAAILCSPGFCAKAATTYYSGPDHKTVVGACACGTCTGEKTNFFTTRFVCCEC